MNGAQKQQHKAGKSKNHARQEAADENNDDMSDDMSLYDFPLEAEEAQKKTFVDPKESTFTSHRRKGKQRTQKANSLSFEMGCGGDKKKARRRRKYYSFFKI